MRPYPSVSHKFSDPGFVDYLHKVEPEAGSKVPTGKKTFIRGQITKPSSFRTYMEDTDAIINQCYKADAQCLTLYDTFEID